MLARAQLAKTRKKKFRHKIFATCCLARSRPARPMVIEYLSAHYLPFFLVCNDCCAFKRKKNETCFKNSNHNSIVKNFDDGDCKFRPPQRSLI